MSTKKSFPIGSLYPLLADGSPNLILSSGYQLKQNNNGYTVRERNKGKDGSLEADLNITTQPVQVPGIDRFVSTWLKPQMLAKEDPASIFNQYWKSIVDVGWGVYPNNLLLEALSYLGYRGFGWDKASESSGYWAQTSSTDQSDPLYKEVRDLSNYKPELIWGNPPSGSTVQSNYDRDNLLLNLAKHYGTFTGDPPLWLPALLFTYGTKENGTSYPGPVLMIRPGESLNLNFENNIRIPGLTTAENQDATLVPNSSYGLNGGSTAGGMFSTNFHMHGGHVTPSGFSDNVVGRYTSGQDWTTSIDIPKDHGQGSYWYHPHYHPAVNTQLYGGLSGFMQVGDPLQKVPGFQDVPRNLAVLKTMQVEVDPQSGNFQLAAVNGNILGWDSLAPNRASMATVNGEYNPTINVSSGGWQSLTLSNQDNNYYMNISINHQLADGSWQSLPLYIYGEDGHQYPQIRAVTNGPLGYDQPGQNAIDYSQASNLVSLPPGKRIDLLYYLPSGQSELVSSYGFTDSSGQPYEINNLRFQANQYADLSSTNVDPANHLSGPGPIARFSVSGDLALPSTSQLDEQINKANRKISVQQIKPTTTQAEYNQSSVPSVNLYAQDSTGSDRWKPIRKREFNYSVLALVGPKDQRDIPTQQAISEYDAQHKDQPYQTYTPVPQDPTWLGYENPDFINDHAFPNGPLIIAQLGTMEEWSLKNWNWSGPSVPNGGYLVGHPFHIHLNDYQVKQSDNELPNKRNLEDVTMLNSSGYNYADENGVIHKLDPLVGTFTPIPEAFDYTSDLYKNGLFTTGYNDTTVRMLFQDYLGTYVHHCHLLEHEDAGMMQVVTVIENADSSWILPAQDLSFNDRGLRLRKADTLSEVTLRLDRRSLGETVRADVGDLSGDFVQDIILSSSAKLPSGSGRVDIYDGSRLLKAGSSSLITSFTPYSNSTLAPWASNTDFTGDGKRELVTAGFRSSQGSSAHLSDFEITGWLPPNGRGPWTADFHHNPWQGVANVPEGLISSKLTSFAVGDFNLDNFDDYALAYLDDNKLRVRILDGAAVALFLQTGLDEGGYLPNVSILSDMTFSSPDLAGVESIALTTGFNSYAQSPIENLVVTAQSSSGHSSAFTFQLDAGHFISTGTANASMDSEHGSHGGQSVDPSMQSDVMNDGPMPLHLSSSRSWHGSPAVATPTFAGAQAQGCTVLNDHLVIGQGVSQGAFSYGNESSSDLINNTTQDLFIGLDGIDRVSRDDLTGIVTTSLDSSLSSSQSQERLNLALLAYQAYTNSWVKPSSLAQLAAGVDGGSLSVPQLINRILQDHSASVVSYYGGALDRLPVSDIVNKAYQALYRRNPKSSETDRWTKAVAQGLSQNDLPMAILQSSSGRDQINVALLSAASQWSQIQWGTSASIDGAYGQGLQSNLSTYDQMMQLLSADPVPSTWHQAQGSYVHFMQDSLEMLKGTPISDTGFF